MAAVSPNNTKTPYGLALDLAFDIVQRDNKDNENPKRSLRPGLTDEYTLARALLDVQPYITSLKNDLEEAELNVNANARDASNCRAALEETRSENSKLKGQLEEAVAALEKVCFMIEHGWISPDVIGDTQEGWDKACQAYRDSKTYEMAKELLSKLKEAGS